MKDKWRLKYEQVRNPEKKSVLTGFNVNIDCIYRSSEIDTDLDDIIPEKIEKIGGPEELNKVLKYCIENRENMEVRGRYMAREFEGATRKIGGQAGIISNFLSKTGHYSGLYTPFLSQEIVDLLEDDIVYPEADGRLHLKRIRDAVNTDRTKKNMIVDIDQGKSCRLIVSDRLKGFGPYFRKGIEDRLSDLSKEFDGFIFSGFHDADGNFETKIDKVQIQLTAINEPKHLEYVGMEKEKSKIVVEKLLPEFTSIGLDESEALQIGRLIGKDFGEELSLGEAFQLSKKLIKEKDLERVHIHTYRYHVTVLDDCENPEKVRDGMLYADKAGIALAEQGVIPDKDAVENISTQENIHLHRLDDLEHFRHHLGLENFTETGITGVKDLTVIAVPTLIHENPERVVGMGDIISSSAFTYNL